LVAVGKKRQYLFLIPQDPKLEREMMKLQLGS
jgi:hypothetical protein